MAATMLSIGTNITDTHENGTPAYSFEPWTDGHAIGFKVTRHAGYFVTVNDNIETDIKHDTEQDAEDEAANVIGQVDNFQDVAVKHVEEAVSYVYLNPSTDTWSDGRFRPDVFVYTGSTGKPAEDSPHHFYNIDFGDDE